MMKYPYICPVCGYWPTNSYSDKFRWWYPGEFDICPCCNVEYGNETSGADGPEDEIFTKLRNQWMNSGFSTCRSLVDNTPQNHRSRSDPFVLHDEKHHMRQLKNIKILVEVDKALSNELAN